MTMLTMLTLQVALMTKSFNILTVERSIISMA